MPKITVHGGPSNKREETPSAGNSSSTSDDKQKTKPEQKETPDQQPALTTEKSSVQVQEENFSVSSTGGSGKASTAGKTTIPVKKPPK